MRRRFVTVLVAIYVTGIGAAFGQAGSLPSAAAAASTAAAASSAAGAIAFDVASVRPAAVIDQATIFAGLRAGRRPWSMHLEADRVTFTYTSLRQLAAYAYKVRDYQVSGPDWMATDRSIAGMSSLVAPSGNFATTSKRSGDRADAGQGRRDEWE